ncbi:MAG: hypothetical protein EOO03_15940 [Chitinophagaceae bacterium]|nr:MAG: hypothetical protein EOO03_15940 [Chitinophagaceae bacterium]
MFFFFALMQRRQGLYKMKNPICGQRRKACVVLLCKSNKAVFFFALMQKRNKKNQGCGKMAKNCAGCLARGETRFLLTLLIADTTGSNSPRLPLPQAAKRLPAQFS